MNYLDHNLLTLNSNLLRTNFDRILDSIWVEVLEELEDVLSQEEMVRCQARHSCVTTFKTQLYFSVFSGRHVEDCVHGNASVQALFERIWP